MLDHITLEDLDSAEGQRLLEAITNKVLENNRDVPLIEMHPEDAEANIECTRHVIRAIIELSEDVSSD